jgi:hypothetical protein
MAILGARAGVVVRVDVWSDEVQARGKRIQMSSTLLKPPPDGLSPGEPPPPTIVGALVSLSEPK